MIASHDARLTTLAAGFGDDTWVAAHARVVSVRCVAMALVLGFGRRRCDRLALAASLHDIGKLMLPAGIVDKPARLTDAEAALMRRHPELGADALEQAGMAEVAHIVRHHHERVDGAGYPDGLRGEDIPLESRIIFVADAFDAMTAERPYAPARSEDEALAEVILHADRQFDRRCVAALLATLPLVHGARDGPPVRAQARTRSMRSSRPSIVAGSPRPLPS